MIIFLSNNKDEPFSFRLIDFLTQKVIFLLQRLILDGKRVNSKFLTFLSSFQEHAQTFFF